MRSVPLLGIVALLSCATLGYAQGAQDFSKVEIKTNKVTDKFYTLDGQGGTIGVLIGPDGVFMVDTQFAPLSDKIAAAIKQRFEAFRNGDRPTALNRDGAFNRERQSAVLADALEAYG